MTISTTAPIATRLSDKSLQRITQLRQVLGEVFPNPRNATSAHSTYDPHLQDMQVRPTFFDPKDIAEGFGYGAQEFAKVFGFELKRFVESFSELELERSGKSTVEFMLNDARNWQYHAASRVIVLYGTFTCSQRDGKVFVFPNDKVIFHEFRGRVGRLTER